MVSMLSALTHCRRPPCSPGTGSFILVERDGECCSCKLLQSVVLLLGNGDLTDRYRVPEIIEQCPRPADVLPMEPLKDDLGSRIRVRRVWALH